MSTIKAPIGRTVIAAFAALVLLGGASLLGGLTTARRLAASLRAHAQEVSIHDRVARFRSGLLDVSLSVHEYALGHAPEAEKTIRRHYELLAQDAAACDTCHARSGARVRVAGILRRMEETTRSLLNAQDAATLTALLQEYDSATTSLRGKLATMEDRYARQVARQRALDAEVLSRATRPLWLFLVSAVLMAGALGVWLTRNVRAPIRRLIETARRIGAGEQSDRIEPSRDPDLAELGRQFQDMTTKVTRRANEAARDRLMERVLSSQEDERKRIARELHDQIGQSLAALLLRLRSDAAATDGTRGSEEMVRALIDRVRQMAWDLRPSILSDHGLEAALGRHVQEESSRSRIPIDYQYVCDPGVPRRLAESPELVIYRVAQEAIHNALMHSGATRLSVVVLRERRQVTLLVEDDGRGFDVEAARADAERCLGLLGMEERVTLAGGGLTITSSPGAGCSVRARVPDVVAALERNEACPSAS